MLVVCSRYAFCTASSGVKTHNACCFTLRLTDGSFDDSNHGDNANDTPFCVCCKCNKNR